MATPTAQLHFILARDAPVGVIFQRRSKKLVQVIKWNTDTDTFESGQWFKGRIYEDRSDISPDGTKLLYFAEKITRATCADPDYTTHWTAVSKLPYLTALALWPNGYGPRDWPYVRPNEINDMCGGGTFLSDNEVLLNSPNLTPHPAHVPQGLVVRSSYAWIKPSRNLTELLINVADNEPLIEAKLVLTKAIADLHDLYIQSLKNKPDSHGWEHVQELKVEYVESPYWKLRKERESPGYPLTTNGIEGFRVPS